MNFKQNARSVIVVGGLAFVGVAATLPFTLETTRERRDMTRPANTATVKLTCFDRDMRPNDCVVTQTTSVAEQCAASNQ